MTADECLAAGSDGGGMSWCDLWGGNRCVTDYCQIAAPASEQATSAPQCQIGYCCSSDAGVAPQNDGGPAHGVCAMGAGCPPDAATGVCCDPSAGGK
jgi:hypothetical protein